MNRRVPNGTHGGVRGRKSPLETFSYSINLKFLESETSLQLLTNSLTEKTG
jgi:hypothetical protein